jgi:hypothetical protein
MKTLIPISHSIKNNKRAVNFNNELLHKYSLPFKISVIKVQSIKEAHNEQF